MSEKVRVVEVWEVVHRTGERRSCVGGEVVRAMSLRMRRSVGNAIGRPHLHRLTRLSPLMSMCLGRELFVRFVGVNWKLMSCLIGNEMHFLGLVKL